ncbi:AMP-dependent CoA ligase/synthetase (AssK1) [Desulfatibacillum aliphaticivorans]|uniref:AMP-dependent CoA ligase/synthetase (AssK1) n=1 Tax=Desulfatibacillum aliphaticivorans TaxID=218208 RepID=B8FFM9_DESAL|nr:AMP-binding protein [Desulfatibacillum aliphaticivorans]ACL03434.1 AMP-dependent CoA ligase/synthetase (AssK1) [Desulfatibacillum aliphaticivorans]
MSTHWDVGYIIKKREQNTPDKTAVIFEDEPFSYKQLNQGANRCAHYLQQLGIKKGDRIGVLMLNCMEFLECYFAAAKLGVIFVPLNWRLTGPELEYQINDSQCRLLLFHDCFFYSIDPVRSNLKVENDKFVYCQSGNPDAPARPDWAVDFHAGADDKPVSEPVPDSPIAMDDDLAIVYTSGVTGNPKGAVLSHGQTYFKCFQTSLYVQDNQDISANEVMVAQMPLFHSGGLFIVATPVIFSGITLVMRRGFNPDEFAQDIERYKATAVFALTTMWRFILDTGKLDQIDVSSVRSVMGGGERTPPSLFEELAKRGLYMQQGFGQTECSAMTLVPKEDIQRKMGSIGKPGFFAHVWIGDNNGKELPPGEIGHILAKGPTVMSRYWNLPDMTEKAIVNGILNTGDLGYMDEEGYLYIVDRAKDMYRSGGENVYPAEVEKILAGHPKVLNVSIIGVPDEKWGETGAAFIVPAMGQELAEEEVLEYLQGKAARFKHPSKIFFVEELPLTATMKVKKMELKEEYAKFQQE